MKTPIADFLREYSTRGATRLHMPGHKGILESPHDITEVGGADVLYSPTGIIAESERNASELFGTARTVYSTEGSSLSIKAMLALVLMYAKEKGLPPLILAARNAHKALLCAMALLDFEVEWIYGESLTSCKVSPEMLREAIRRAKEPPLALYVTSPDYLGNLNDIKALSEVCREFGILLLVDNAHGAYLKFLPSDMHPITLGADMCCDSAHKTLPALTGAGYLHISHTAPKTFCERADEAMALFASTSPSYLILESLDKTNAYLSWDFRKKLEHFVKISDKMKDTLRSSGFRLVGDEVLKITVKTKEYGYTGWDISKFLEESDIIAEFACEDFVTLMLSPLFSDSDIERVTAALTKIPKKSPIAAPAPPIPALERKLSVKAAMLSPSELVCAEESVGRILSAATVSCPPAVPVAMSGELITKEAAECFKYYGTEKIRVVK